jgi:hypothetical protein
MDLDHALSMVRITLFNLAYSSEAEERIAAYLKVEGTAEGCPDLDAEDVEMVHWAYDTYLPTVPWDDPSWDADDACWTPSDTVRLDVEDLDIDCLPAISGGSPDAYEPTALDLAEYAAWSASLDGADEVRTWLNGNPSFAEWLDANGGPAE